MSTIARIDRAPHARSGSTYRHLYSWLAARGGAASAGVVDVLSKLVAYRILEPAFSLGAPIRASAAKASPGGSCSWSGARDQWKIAHSQGLLYQVPGCHPSPIPA